MNRRHLVIGAVLIVAVAFAAPAIGGSERPATTSGKAGKALKKAKKALKKAKKNAKATKLNESAISANGSAIAANGDAIEKGTAWAKVSDGSGTPSLLREKGVASVSGGGTGAYRVTFDDPITGCGWFATLNDDSDGLPPEGEIAINFFDLTDPRTLQVRTYDSAGNLGPVGGGNGFSVAVLC